MKPFRTSIIISLKWLNDMKRYIQIVALVSLLLGLQACASFEMPEYRGNEDFKLEKVEGRKIIFQAGATVYNPNWFGIRVKPSIFEMYIDNDFMGTVELTKKVKLKRKRESNLSAPLEAELVEGAMLKAMRSAGKGDLSVRFKGKAKAGVFLFSKKIDVDETIKIPVNKIPGGMFR